MVKYKEEEEYVVGEEEEEDHEAKVEVRRKRRTKKRSRCMWSQHAPVHDVQGCSYAGRRPLDSLADIRAAHHSGVPCVEIYYNINITRRLQILFLTTHNNSLEPTAFHFFS